MFISKSSTMTLAHHQGMLLLGWSHYTCVCTCIHATPSVCVACRRWQLRKSGCMTFLLSLGELTRGSPYI